MTHFDPEMLQFAVCLGLALGAILLMVLLAREGDPW